MRSAEGAFFVAGMVAVIVANGPAVQNLLPARGTAAPDYRNCAIQVLTLSTDHGASRLGAYVVFASGGELTKGPFRSTTATMML